MIKRWVNLLPFVLVKRIVKQVVPGNEIIGDKWYNVWEINSGEYLFVKKGDLNGDKNKRF